MILTFVKNINGKYYKKIEINFDTDMKQFSFRYDDILKDKSLKNLKYWTDISCVDDINKLVNNYGYKFASIDTDKKIINLKRDEKVSNADIFTITDFFVDNQYNKDYDGYITSDCIFNIDDLDTCKYENFKEIIKDYDDVKIKEYSDNEYDFEFDDNILTCTQSAKTDKKYYFNISILNELIIINKQNNKLYVLQCPVGLDYKLIGIKNINDTSYLKYTEPLDYTKNEISINYKNLNHSFVKPMIKMENIMINTFIETCDLDEKSLNDYNNRMKTLFDMNIILGIYDL